MTTSDKPDRGGVPKPQGVDELLELRDGELASGVVGAMCVEPRPENFAALGRLLKLGAANGGKAELELALLRRGRR